MNEFNIRKRENNLSLSQNKTYKSQYELLLNKYNNNSSNDKINEIENKINQIRIDNINIIKKIRDLKTKHNLKKKKLEILSKNKKIPHEINTKTDDIQSLNSKKFEYYNKLNQNIRSLNNIKIFLEKVKKNYNESGINNKKINDEFNEIENDLEGDSKEIFFRVENGKSLIVNNFEKRELIKLKKKNLYLNNNINYNIYNINQNLINKTEGNNNINTNVSSNLYSARKYYIDASNKLNSKKKNMSPINHPNFIKKNNNNSYIINNNNKITIQSKPLYEEKDYSNITYENCSDYEFKDMLKKKENWFSINLKLENSIKEANKMYERKVKDMENKLYENNEKLNNLIEENNLLKNEIENIEKIMSTNKEEKKVGFYDNNNNKINEYESENIIDNNNKDEGEVNYKEINNNNNNKINNDENIESEKQNIFINNKKRTSIHNRKYKKKI